MFVVVYGNLEIGFEIFGPFETLNNAKKWAVENYDQGEWIVLPLQAAV